MMFGSSTRIHPQRYPIITTIKQNARPVFFASALSLLVVSRSMLVTVSKETGGKSYSYDPVSVVLLTEVMKFALAFALFSIEAHNHKRSVVKTLQDEYDSRVAWLYSIPALMYAIQNLIVFRALIYLAPPTFELFSNLKIVTTAIVFRVVMRQSLTEVQWSAVVLLFLGTIIGQLSTLDTPSIVWKQTSDGATDDKFIGFFLCLLYALLSAIAGIYTEKTLKGSKQSTHLQNMEIYFWSILVNLVIGYYERGSVIPPGGFFHNYSVLTWIIVINGALMGQCVSFVMKYANNIVKVFAGCIALFISTFLSMIFTTFRPNLLLMLGFGVTVVSLFLYFGPHNDILKADEKHRKAENPNSIV